MYKIAHDTSCFAKYVEDVGQCKRDAQLARTYHFRAENKRGSNAVLEFLEASHKHEVGLLTDNDVLEIYQEGQFRKQFCIPQTPGNTRISQSSCQTYYNPSLQWMNAHRPDAVIVWSDLTKYGRLQTDDMNNRAEAVRVILNHWPNVSIGVIIVPVLSSSKVGAGVRGELRSPGCQLF